MLVLPLEIVRVRGRSMLPTYAEGDLLLVTSRGRRRPGVAVVVRLPADDHGLPRPRAVKRLLHRDDDGQWWFDSDNPGAGLTSFDIGPLPESAIEGVVLARIPRRVARVLDRPVAG